MYRTIIAVYDSLRDTTPLRRDLESAGAPASHVQISSDGADRTGAASRATDSDRSGGFLDWLFGVPDEERSTYGQHMSAGRTIVTVHAPEAGASAIEAILERYGPTDIDATNDAGSAGRGAALAGSGDGRLTEAGPGVSARTQADETTEARIPVAEEDVRIGKRDVERGRVRVRSYVVEQPIEELVRLRDETVRVERRPVAGDAPMGGDAFQERTIEMSEHDEEPVVEKRARVKEEVVIKKDVGERTERVQERARRTQVDVDKESELEHAGPGTTRRR
jgi:uncharacterized protein (TIGR02271 family)